MRKVDDINRELIEVQDALLALSDDAVDERFRLRQRQAALREEAQALQTDWLAERPTEELIAELEALRARLAEIEADRIDLVKQHGGGGNAGPGADGWGAVQLNQQIESAQGADAIKERIGRIKGILVDRGAADS